MTMLTGTPEQRMTAVIAVYDDAMAHGATRRQAATVRRAFARGEPVPDLQLFTGHLPSYTLGLTERCKCQDCGVYVSGSALRCRKCNATERHKERGDWPEPVPVVFVCDRCGGDMRPRPPRKSGGTYCKRCAAIVRWHPEEAVA